MGRKALPKEQCRSAVVRVRMTADEEARYMEAIQRGGYESLSAYIRAALDLYTERVMANVEWSGLAEQRQTPAPVPAPVVEHPAPIQTPQRAPVRPSDSFLQPAVQGPSLAMLGIPFFSGDAEPRVFDGFDDDYVDEP